jgi:peptidoglycan/LPS O-acetylase OafA/YrhL
VVSGSKIFKGVMTIGLTCLALLVLISVLSAFIQIPTAQQLITTLDRAFMLCLGAVLALMGKRKLSKRR